MLVVLEMLEVKFLNGTQSIKVQETISIGFKLFIAFNRLENQVFDLSVLSLIRLILGHISDFLCDFLIDFRFGSFDMFHEAINSLNLSDLNNELISFLHEVVDLMSKLGLAKEVRVHLHKAII